MNKHRPKGCRKEAPRASPRLQSPEGVLAAAGRGPLRPRKMASWVGSSEDRGSLTTSADYFG